MAKSSEHDRLKDLFEKYARFGDTHRTGDHITLKNVDKWFHQANLLKPTGTLQEGETAIAFSKLARTKNVLHYQQFLDFIGEVSRLLKQPQEILKRKLRHAGRPGYNNPTVYAQTPLFDRLTDINRFTGIQKYKFGCPSVRIMHIKRVIGMQKQYSTLKLYPDLSEFIRKESSHKNLAKKDKRRKFSKKLTAR